MIDRRIGEGYIFLNGKRDIEFLVDGNEIKHGHIVTLKTEGNDAPKFEEDKIWFCVDYITDFGTQCASIPWATEEKIHRFKQITKEKAFIVFRTEAVNPLINGIGTMGGVDNWLFWDVDL